LAAKIRPLTLCRYQINYDAILDLTSVQVRQQLDINLDDLACRWRLDRARGTFPQSWKLAENLISSGVPGILAQSFAPDATTHNINLILWVWSDHPPTQITLYDPDRQLRKKSG
jgi:RES domain-containing protein